ncbi:MAG: hypothetical protein JSW23_00630 [Planctomycetota bacterium]|nr:MAG: hypothetical protein JSW23_00630 [Planctomycetota bacterium]
MVLNNTRRIGLMIRVIGAALLVLLLGSAAYGQLTLKDIEKLRKKGEVKGWTFTVGLNPATQYSLDELCGQLPEKNEDKKPRTSLDEWGIMAGFVSAESLPSAFDWRALGGCTPIKNQQNCASCWAFSAVGAFESAIVIYDGVVEDLSEQWLISCTDAGNCGGGYYSKALNYFAGWASDDCGDVGAVLESDFGYTARNSACGCPYDHYYMLMSWYYTGDDVASIKEAIYNYGPVCTSVYVNTAFQAYTGGIFNACQDKETNHAVVLVGWNDSQGTNGVWIVRNSWGPEWGEEGYMRIEYGCSRIQRATAYVNYGVESDFMVYPLNDFQVLWATGDPASNLGTTYTIRNYSDEAINWTATKTQDWLDVAPTAGSLDARAYAEVQVSADANDLETGIFTDTVTFTDTTHNIVKKREVKILVNYECPSDADLNGDSHVNLADFAKLASYWYQSCTEPEWCQGGDLDCSGVINADDLHRFCHEWLW